MSAYAYGLDARAGHWRRTSAEIIAGVLKANEGRPEAEIRKAISEAYPFGQRKYHPYKIWLSEIARQMGKNQMFKLRHPGRRQLMSIDPDPRQESLGLDVTV